MEKTYGTLTPEHQLIIICSRGVLSEEEKNIVTATLNSPNLDWSEILYQALFHRSLNLLYYHLKNMKILNLVEEEILKLMHHQSSVYRLRNEGYKTELLSLGSNLINSGIKFAILKGSYLAYNAYPVMESRTFNDIDLLVKLEDGKEVLNLVTSDGYIQGDYDRNTFEIKPATRKQMVMHQMTTHEFLECLKPSDNPFIPLLQLDLNHSILWKGNCPYNVNSAELVDRAVLTDIDGKAVWVLTPEDLLLQLSCHLYKEAVMINWIHDLRDLKLYKFADFVVYLDKFKEDVDWEVFVERVQGYGLAKVVYFAFYYVDYLYNVIPPEVMRTLKPDDTAYLNEYAIETEQPRTWTMGFYERLFNSKHRLEIDKTTLTAYNEFWAQRKQ